MTLSEFLNQHLVRYVDLIPCTTAFIDTRTPGSKEKENFTIIGPGVSENPDQHVHIKRPHGFNIGGARQPPNCVNSQHSHDTAEVFVVQSGTWAFTTGEHGHDGCVVLGPGDTISIPTQAFRGFENIGEDEGFLFAVLGGDDPGRVTWAPYVFEQAKNYGLVLLENGALVDTAAGESLPNDVSPMPPTTLEIVERLQTLNDQQLEACVVRHCDVGNAPRVQKFPGEITESHILGTASNGSAQPPLGWQHDFQLHHLRLEAGANTGLYSQAQEEVFMMHKGQLLIEVGEHVVTLHEGDVFTAPVSEPRQLSNALTEVAEVFVVHRGERPQFSTIET